ncbi:MAG: flippase-like domain-containing protein, partial [Myxococcales bacterium]|nr:flippase-like domain-containing protein [Myxococcales bacterium]
VGALALWLLRGGGAAALVDALRPLPLSALFSALGVGVVIMVLAGLRWRVLMMAFGAAPLPSLPTLVRGFLIGLFYNSFLPGSIGGDVVRGVISRRCFSEATASYLVVALERMIGLSTLGLVFLLGMAVRPPPIALDGIWPWIAGLLALGVALLVFARVSGRLARWWEKAPRVASPVGLVGAALLSLPMHGGAIAMFALLGDGLGLPLEPLAWLAVVPLVLVASALPVAIAGLGPREVAVVALLGAFGVAQPQALALSLSYWAALMLLALLGGLVQLVWGISLADGQSALSAEPPGKVD